MVMACDMHIRAEENMRSLTLAIDAMAELNAAKAAALKEIG